MFSGSRHHADRCARYRAGWRRDTLHHAAGASAMTGSAVTVAVAQFSSIWDKPKNIAKAKDMVRLAASRGANVVVLPELFATPYFCQDQFADHFALAEEFRGNTLVGEFAA